MVSSNVNGIYYICMPAGVQNVLARGVRRMVWLYGLSSLFIVANSAGKRQYERLLFQDRYDILLPMRLSSVARQIYMGNPRLNNYGFWHYNCLGVLRNCIFDSLFRKELL